LDRHDLRGNAFCQAYARAWDEWLSSVAEGASAGDPRHLALLAVGGYGRGMLWPYSDLDVVLIHTGRRQVAPIADDIWYPVWDQGVRLDHSVRRPKEVLTMAGADLRVALGMLDARLIWGDPKVSAPLIEAILELWRSRLGAQWLPTLFEQMAERRRRYGDVAFLLEPDLKESHGGLRDVNVLMALATCAPALADYVDLLALDPAAAVLTEVRVELHRKARRNVDRLLLQEQDGVAAALDYPDADALMARLSGAGRAIAWVSDDALRRQRFWHPPAATAGGRPWRRSRSSRSDGHEAREPREVPADPALLIVNGEVVLAPSAPVAQDASLALRLAAVSAELELPIARGALHRLAERMPELPDPWPDDTRSALVRVLMAGHPAIDALEALDHYELLGRILPEWQAVRNRPQRNAYHTYTVDRHLLEAAARASTLADRVTRADLLVVAALLHDIGKGSTGDHTQAGVEMVGTIAERMGFDAADIDTLVRLVRLHLLLPDTATRRDLDDPLTIETVADAVGDPETLALLAALTEADSLATGPSAWGGWKAGLVAELVKRTLQHLQGSPVEGGSWVTEAHRRFMSEVRATGRPAVVLEPPQVLVAAPDRRGLLASVAGTLALHGLDVRSADVTSEGGVALEVFTVDVGPRAWPEGSRLREDLDDVLSRRIALGSELAEKARAYAGRSRPVAARPVVPYVRVDNLASATSTVVELRAPDEIGLLHRVTRALFSCDLNVVSARVSTVGNEVVDAFYVRDADGHKVLDRRAIRHVERAVQQAISGRRTRGEGEPVPDAW
jgi:[protein-PII] uridylyltransferase